MFAGKLYFNTMFVVSPLGVWVTSTFLENVIIQYARIIFFPKKNIQLHCCLICDSLYFRMRLATRPSICDIGWTGVGLDGSWVGRELGWTGVGLDGSWVGRELGGVA